MRHSEGTSDVIVEGIDSREVSDAVVEGIATS